MKLLELIFTIYCISLLSLLAWLPFNQITKNDTRSYLTTLYALKRARMLALADTSYLGHIGFEDVYSFRSVDRKRLLLRYEPFYWQLQFHTSGIYTKNSLSLYRDTPRFATTTDFDRRPLAGDIVALSTANLQCLSGYNNTNLPARCKNNALFDFRLSESNKLQNLRLLTPSTCQERDTFRFYFSDYSRVLCGNPIHEINGIQGIQVAQFHIFLNAQTGYIFLP
ncbi:hypothetical protein [Helicobacter sp. MIT 14-3879]|uniref:hypothetical protein n=1 Tax=Helicobacter sp. MIT 14-3879 TaxID=2040649 RepID=UPI000E1F97C5|nr:hypothetical protein [Helicobacter sp. MIT 14-3879]RDU59881.1 hypothetical protein CQA44_11055 [Helicobacter sp. MIT 14-3879]